MRRYFISLRATLRWEIQVDCKDYQILLDLYEQKSITKVAQKHYLSQPALTIGQFA